MNYADLTAEELLVWSRDHLEFLQKQEWFVHGETSTPELVDRINNFLTNLSVADERRAINEIMIKMEEEE
mgnify:FL=1